MSKPFAECELAERPVLKKGWGGTSVGQTDGVGEVFVYHGKKDLDLTHITPETIKLLYIAKDKKLSLHFHIKKCELFYLVVGQLEVELISDGQTRIVTLNQHDTLLIRPGMVHSMKGLSEENVLLEVSTLDDPWDSYRIKKGD